MPIKTESMGNPTPIGLMGLALGCAALAPAELSLTSLADPKIWLWMLMTAGFLQIFAGIVDLINKNVLGATGFMIYGTLWSIAGWQLGSGVSGDPMVKVYIYMVFLLFTMFMTVGFMTVSLNLTIVFIEFIIIFILEILAGFIPELHHFALKTIGVLHTLAAIQVVWAAAGGILNVALGRDLFPQGKPPLPSGKSQEGSDNFASLRQHLELRKEIIKVLYQYWEQHHWEWMSALEMCEILGRAPHELQPDSWYLYQKGYVAMDEKQLEADPDSPKMIRLTAAGIDYYGELQMSKFKF